MKKILLIGCVCSLSVGCAGNMRDGLGDGTTVIDDAGYAHHTMSYLMDSRGSMSFPQHQPGTGKKVFVFDPKIPAWALYDAHGDLIKTGSASGGKDFCEDVGHSCRTTTGHYRIYSKKGPECRSSKYPIETGGGAKMPYCMHFNGGYSIHAAYEVPNYNTSHGCIRVLPSAAKWLNENMSVGSTVVVKPY